MELDTKIELLARKLGARKIQINAIINMINCWLTWKVSPEFLLAAACRFGKTRTALIAIIVLAELLGVPYCVAILSALPGSVGDSWNKDGAALGMNVTTVDTLDMNDLDKDSITFISQQKAIKNPDGTWKSNVHEFINHFNNHKGVKVLLLDEAHVAIGTEKTKEFLKQLNNDYALHITATPNTEELITRYHLDQVEGDKRSFTFSQVDMLKLYKEAFENGTLIENGFTIPTNWVPVTPKIYIENLYETAEEEFNIKFIDEEDAATGFISAYFKTIFNDVEKYAEYCDSFIDTYILTFAKNHGNNVLGFTTTNASGSKIASYINRKYSDSITAICLGDEETGDVEKDIKKEDSAVKRANDLFAKEDGKIHFVITCRKCGTGSTMPLLNTVIFMKGVRSYTEFAQFSARCYNPSEGKKYGNVILFNPETALKMISYAAGNKTEPKEGEPVHHIHEVLDLFEIYIDGNRVIDATELIQQLDTKMTRNTILFPTLNEELFNDQEMRAMLADPVLELAKTKKQADRKPSQPKDDDSTKSTGEDNPKEPKPRPEPDPNDKKGDVTKQSIAEAFQKAFIHLIKDLATSYSEEEIKTNYIITTDKRRILNQLCVTSCLCKDMKLWNILVEKYFDKILHKVYIYVTKLNDKEDQQNA